jgi:hypothetical protein
MLEEYILIMCTCDAKTSIRMRRGQAWRWCFEYERWDVRLVELWTWVDLFHETHVSTVEQLGIQEQRWDEECDNKSLFVSSVIQTWHTPFLPCKSSPHNTSTSTRPLFVSPTPRNAIPERQCNAPTTLISRETRSLRRHHQGSSGWVSMLPLWPSQLVMVGRIEGSL